MQKSRRIFIGVALLGLMAVLMVLQPWRGKAPVDDLPGDTPARADGASAPASVHPLTSSPDRIATAGATARVDPASQCSNILEHC